MPRIIRVCMFDESFTHRRDAFLQVLHANLAEAMKDAPAFQEWLQTAHAPATVWKTLEKGSAWANQVLAGQPHVEGKPSALQSAATPRLADLGKTERQLLTLGSAASEVCDHARRRGEAALFGPGITKTRNRLHALRVVLLAGIVIDPEAAESLGRASPLAELPWDAGRVRVCKVYGEELLRLTVTACDVLRWAPAPDELGHPPRPAAIEIAIDRFAKLLTRSESVERTLAAWHERDEYKQAKFKKTQRPEGPGELPEDVLTPRDLLAHKRARASEPGNEASPWRSLWDARDDLTFSVRRWREALDSARAVVAGAGKWLDNPQADPLTRWSAEVIKELNAFGGLIHRHRVGDTPLALRSEDLALHIAAVRKRLSNLWSISGTLQSAIDVRAKAPNAKGEATNVPIGKSGPAGPPDEPTIPISLAKAAKPWFGCVKKTLAGMIDSGAIKATRETKRLWVFDCGEVDMRGFATDARDFHPQSAVKERLQKRRKDR